MLRQMLMLRQRLRQVKQWLCKCEDQAQEHTWDAMAPVEGWEVETRDSPQAPMLLAQHTQWENKRPGFKQGGR